MPTEHHFIIGIISDNDEKSKSRYTPDSWESKFVRGKLIWDERSRHLSVEFDRRNTKVLTSGFNLGGRGMELSELIYYDAVLTAFDDKSGIVYKIENGDIYPWVILASGDGKMNKGFKSEWATVKSNRLIVGSHGTLNGYSRNPRTIHETQWVKVIGPNGEVRHVNWVENYARVQNSSGCVGYLTHEAVCWSEMHKKWFFLPRKCSYEAYSADTYDRKGSNILISTDDYFQTFHKVRVGKLSPTQGFSSFKFLPGSNDMIIIALKTMESRSSSMTHITAFTLEGEILLEDTLISNTDKFEGMEFIHPYDPILNYTADDDEYRVANSAHLQMPSSQTLLTFWSTIMLIICSIK
ncbi:apyrase-like [Diaphorina citri]|jgi:Apyrase.|uniref:Apyrase-like n=1 Tax=Diaphorina citri TaxID=121845 RepID=A0A1S3DS04_DIACI|nr:apyrase-like [Diaphorina citri]